MRIASDEIGTTPLIGPRPLRTHPSPIPVRRCQQRLGVANPNLASTARLAAVIAGALTLGACVIAIAVHVALAADTRAWLRFPFTGLPPRPTVATQIFFHNLRALLAVAGLLLVAQSPFWSARTDEPGPVHRIVRRSGEVLLGAGIAANVIVVGASLGAYATRMVLAALPHGPVELGAYALALSLSLQGRDRPLPGRLIVAVAAFSVVALALAAILETFVKL
jgi:hypothetical protein